MLIKMQEMLMHQGDEIQRLSDEMYVQQKEIASLRSQLAQMQSVATVTPDGVDSRELGPEPPPPHY